MIRSLLLGMAMIVAAGSAWAEDPSADAKKYLPIAVTCPTDNQGVLELISINRLHNGSRLDAVWEHGKVTRVTYFLKVANKDWLEIKEIKLGNEANPEAEHIAEFLAARADKTLLTACLVTCH